MSHSNKVTQYWEHLLGLSYPEYALNHIDDDSDDELTLNLSLWNDDLPPGVMEVAMHALPRAVGAYGFTQDKTLITLLAQRLGVADDNVIITAGADDALRIAAQYCIRPGARTLIPIPCFGRYTYHAMVQEAKIHYLCFGTYPFEFDVSNIIDAVHKKKIECLLIASPNNPTGHELGRESLKHLLDTASCSIILDESLLLSIYDSESMALATGHQNVFVCGSFSKLYGLPGLRVGYLVAATSHAEQLRKLVSPFAVGALGLEIAKHMVVQDNWLQGRIAAINDGISILRGIDNPRLRVTRTTAPVAIIEHVGTSDDLYRLLRDHGIATVAGEELPGLDKSNTVRVIIKSVNDMIMLKRALVTIS